MGGGISTSVISGMVADGLGWDAGFGRIIAACAISIIHVAWTCKTELQPENASGRRGIHRGVGATEWPKS